MAQKYIISWILVFWLGFDTLGYAAFVENLEEKLTERGAPPPPLP